MVKKTKTKTQQNTHNNNDQKNLPQQKSQPTYTYLLTTATGKLNAGRPVSLMIISSALQEIKL